VLPIRDINQTRRVPVVTYVLIAANLAVFVYQLLLLTPDQNAAFARQHGVIPLYLFSGYGPALSTLFTSLFLHGGLGHVAMNMWFLHVFGDNVEDALGHGRFFVFYLVTGVVAALAHALIDTESTTPLVGASGSISGVLGAYVVLFPRARVVAWAILIVELPAAVFLLIWFGMQVWSGFGTLGNSGPGIAFFAHIGGFVAGVLLVFAAGRPRVPVTYLGARIPTRQMRRLSPSMEDER
jgi:membrane associated rhomboid family serine protease